MAGYERRLNRLESERATESDSVVIPFYSVATREDAEELIESGAIGKIYIEFSPHDWDDDNDT